MRNHNAFFIELVCGKRDKVVTAPVRCMCVRMDVRACVRAFVRPSELSGPLPSTFMAAFKKIGTVVFLEE